MTMNNIGNLCTHCHRDTSFGSGRFVNRIPSFTEDEEGYMCTDCQSMECDHCHEKCLDWETVHGGQTILCYNCYGFSSFQSNGLLAESSTKKEVTK